MENENKKKKTTSTNKTNKTTTKKTSASSSTKKASSSSSVKKTSSSSSAKKTSKKAPSKTIAKKPATKKVEKVEVEEVKKDVNPKKETNIKKLETKETPVLEDTKKEEKEKKVEVIKKETKKEEVKDEITPVISTKTWIITVICGLLLIVSIISYSLLVKKENNDVNTSYYAYVSENKLMLWDKNNEKSIELSSTFLTKADEKFVYAKEDYYVMDNDKIYFIDNVVGSSFDLNYILIADINKTDRKTTRVVEGITNFTVKNGTLAYTKDNNIYLNNEVALKNITDYVLGEDGKNLYYKDNSKNVHAYNVSTKEDKVVEKDYKENLLVLGNDLFTVHLNGYTYEIHKNGEVFATNVTNFSEIDKDFIYYKYDTKYEKQFKELTKKYEESKITFDDIKKIINTKERVLLFIGKPTCGYCSLLEEVFTDINKDKEFTYVYINTLFLEEAELNKLLDFANIKSSEFGTPTLIVTENGKFISSHVGYMEKAEASTFLEENKIFTSKFKYENGEKVSFTPDVMFWASDTYRIVDGKEELVTNGLLYVSNTDKLFDSDYKLNFKSSITDFSKVSVSDLSYDLSLNLTNRKNNSIDTKIKYTDLKAIYLDTRNNYLLYRTSDDKEANYAQIKNGKLKTKATLKADNLCQVTSTKRGTMFIEECDSNGFGKLLIWNGSKLKTVGENVYQIFNGTDDYSYYIKYDSTKKSYMLYSYDKEEKFVSEVYYAFQPTSEVFYVTEDVKVVTKPDNTTTNDYSYKLYMLNGENKSVLLTEKADMKFAVIPIK